MFNSSCLRIFGLSALLLVAGCDGSAGGEKQAQPNLKADFVAAADALIAKTGAPGEKDVMPAANDPAVQAFEAQSGKALAALGTDALPIEGFESFDALCGKSANIVGAYALAGTKGTAGAAQQQKMESNLVKNFDAVFTPLLFSARCNATHMAYFEGLMDGSDPSKATAAKQVRNGLFGQVQGLLQMASDDTMDAGRRQRIVDTLANDGSQFAVGLSPTQRKDISTQAQQVGRTMPEVLRVKLEKLRTELAQAPCGKICSST